MSNDGSPRELSVHADEPSDAESDHYHESSRPTSGSSHSAQIALGEPHDQQPSRRKSSPKSIANSPGATESSSRKSATLAPRTSTQALDPDPEKTSGRLSTAGSKADISRSSATKRSSNSPARSSTSRKTSTSAGSDPSSAGDPERSTAASSSSVGGKTKSDADGKKNSTTAASSVTGSNAAESENSGVRHRDSESGSTHKEKTAGKKKLSSSGSNSSAGQLSAAASEGKPPAHPAPKASSASHADKEGSSDEEGEEESARTILGSILKSSTQHLSEKEGKSGDTKSKATMSIDDLDDEDPTDGAEKDLLDDIQNTLAFLAQTDIQAGAGQGIDPSFARLREEYDKLHKLFMQSRKNEKVLIKKCKDMSSELAANAAKVQAALKLSQNDRITITSMKKEIRKAWKMVEAGSEKEQRSKEAISSLKNEVETLRKTLSEQGNISGASMGGGTPSGGGGGLSAFGWGKINEEQEATISGLVQEKKELEKQLDDSTADKKRISDEMEELELKVQSLTTERGILDHEVHTLKDLLATKKSELDRGARQREKLEALVRQANEATLKKDGDVAAKAQELRQVREQLGRAEQALKEEKGRTERTEKEKEALNTKLNRLVTEYEEQVLTVTRLLSENQKQLGDIKSWEEEYSKMKDEFKNATRVKDSLAKRVKGLEEGKAEAEVERDSLKGINHGITHDLDGVRHELTQAHKQIENLTRERDIAQKNYVKATGATQKQLNTVKLSEQTKRNLEQEIMAYKEEASKMRKLIYSLEKDRDRCINEAGKVEQQLIAKEEEIKIKELTIFDGKKRIVELDRKLTENKALYESIRAERNMLAKNHVEAKDERDEMDRKLKIMAHQIGQLKEEVFSKEAALVKEHFEHSKLEKEKEGLSLQIGKLQQQHEEAQQMIQNQQAEENKLRHIISEADAERLRQKKEYEAVVQERDILGTQLIRRNDELSLLYEKIKIQTSTLNKGEIQYRERLEDIRVLKLEIKRLRREKAILQTETQNVEGLRNEIFRLQREVLRERTRVKVLEEELESPMNIHRWRKLSGSDPSTYELITKIQTLQKRLIAKTEEVVEKELVIQQKERLYKEVKEVLQRQPGPEVIEELRIVKEAVKTKMRECKSLASELNMYHSQSNEYKYEIERLNRELQELKKKYYEQRKRERDERQNFQSQMLRQQQQVLHQYPQSGRIAHLVSQQPPPLPIKTDSGGEGPGGLATAKVETTV
ncbi:hypothetical protein BJ742DRAFT_857002 [Cladochytrium replicatum]|nr:hypothetical protein BJ742DRAFT_857002 [Cladochytrium replicatum]